MFNTSSLKNFPFYRQLDVMDCGPTCLRMVAKYHGRYYSLPFLRAKCYIDREGVSLKGICEAAEYIGLQTMLVKAIYRYIFKSAFLLNSFHCNNFNNTYFIN